MTRDGRLGVGIIGAGRVGPVIGAALAGAGHALVGITQGSDPQRVEAILPGVPMLDAPEVVRRSELVIVAVPHDQLQGLVAVSPRWAPGSRGSSCCTPMPRFGTGVLAPAVAKGAIPLAVHPAIAFTGTSIDLRQLSTAYAAVTAPGPVLPIAQALAVELGCEPVVVAESDRPAYGEAIATATEFSRSIVRQAAGLLAQAGVPNPGSYLSALVHSTIDHALAEAGDGGPRRCPPIRSTDDPHHSTGCAPDWPRPEPQLREGARVALISTIGALHDGHIDLIHRAREVADIVVVSIFVNPLRFATPAEFEAYPRTPDDDRRLLESLGVDVVFAPDTVGTAAATAAAPRR